jgi:hypothetical protein
LIDNRILFPRRRVISCAKRTMKVSPRTHTIGIALYMLPFLAIIASSLFFVWPGNVEMIVTGVALYPLYCISSVFDGVATSSGCSRRSASWLVRWYPFLGVPRGDISG